ncbi:putative zinc-binding metallopeptidase [Spongisporangium articulatum]|uniref:Zinc-binding metallopeptidase n=1 Tax=Spongisporangium articulatum TaxID=3362603 RepID=A0ABW8AKM1_9ACTN
MRTFTCDVCDALVFFENSVCLASDTPLGFSTSAMRIVALTEADDGSLVWVNPDGETEVQCANLLAVGCNWLVEAGVEASADGPLCRSCELTRTRPADSDAVGMEQWAVTEQAKRRLVYQLIDLQLPVVPLEQDPEHGLTFDLLSSAQGEQVTTGHADGVVTIDLAEGDDPHREALRVQLDEPYRTMLGHLRHETGHYYWTVLVEGTERLERFRELFGDEEASYADAIERHYEEGAPAGWEESYVSAYATMHPWEDWAETFAHYLHQRDTLQTAAAAGIVVVGPRAATSKGLRTPSDPLVAVPTEKVSDIQQQIDTWLPLTYALNAVNRSMGKDDLYPFVLSPTVIGKLGFVHEAVLAAADATAAA